MRTTRTKAQVIDEILSIKAIDTRSNLVKNNLAQLESILNDLKKEKSTASTSSVDIQVDQNVDLEALKRELLAQLKEEARKEVEQEIYAKIQAESAERSVSKKAEVDRFELIPVMNITNGSLVYISKKTGAEWNWSEYGDIEYMEFQELLSMRSAQKRFFDEPFILVMHDGAVEHLGLTRMYENMKNPDQIDEVFNLAQKDFEEVVEKSPKGIKHLIVTRARQLYEKGQLDSARKIKYLNERFNTDIGERG